MDLTLEEAALLKDDERATWEDVKFGTGRSDIPREEVRALVRTIVDLRRVRAVAERIEERNVLPFACEDELARELSQVLWGK